MSRERELLESALKFFEDICDARTVGIERAISAYLAEPEVKQEPLLLKDVVKAFDDSDACGIMDNFIAGVLFAEKHHGITGGEK